jgi:hypothetical protein
MKGEPASARVVIDSSVASLHAVSRAALEMTQLCYVWIERTGSATTVTLTERVERGQTPAALEARLRSELERLLVHERLERGSRAVRSAIVGHALARRRKPPAPAQPVLDPETEAEIERLLAEIEDDDWLAEAGEIAKTWEERFGVEPTTCTETKPTEEEKEP